MKRFLAIAAGILCLAAAPDPADMLPNTQQETRARHLFAEIRCVVCQNESIDDSQAELAHDLRQVVRGQVAAGRSDVQIRQFLVGRYGDFILLRPRLNAGNAILWGAPFLIVLAGVGALILRRRKVAAVENDLSAEEETALAAAVARTDDTLQ